MEEKNLIGRGNTVKGDKLDFLIRIDFGNRSILYINNVEIKNNL